VTPKRVRQKAAPVSRVMQVSSRLGQLPRLVRILLVGLFALAVTLALSPLVDLIYDHYFFSTQTVIVPALVTATIGLITYMLGWWLMVGTVGEQPEARAAMVWYFGIGVLAVVIVVYLILTGVSLLNFEG
jgi:hypothetical protein